MAANELSRQPATKKASSLWARLNICIHVPFPNVNLLMDSDPLGSAHCINISTISPQHPPIAPSAISPTLSLSHSPHTCTWPPYIFIILGPALAPGRQPQLRNDQCTCCTMISHGKRFHTFSFWRSRGKELKRLKREGEGGKNN